MLEEKMVAGNSNFPSLILARLQKIKDIRTPRTIAKTLLNSKETNLDGMKNNGNKKTLTSKEA
ncbi:MAG: hypothetical protein AAB966_04355 [Patescibacteria group bacterium]